MRRLTHLDRDDRGVGTILIVLAIVALLVGAAFATDVGRYVVEARSAQNSADATVLAVATDCARNGGPIADYSTYRKTDQSINTPVCGSGEATITVTTPITDGILLQQSIGDVDRSATARWGTLATATTLPITISDCEFSQALLDGTADIILYLDDTKPQSGCSSLPGGFSQLADDGSCAVVVSAGGTADGDPGADLHKVVPCITPLPHDVLVPMYDAAACQASGCKGNGEYPIVGFAMFHVTGYSFNGSAYDGTLGKKCPEEKDRGKYCIRGDFIRFTTSQGTPGPSTDFGTYQIYLSS
jgi:Flp pilus assembly protein TadG